MTNKRESNKQRHANDSVNNKPRIYQRGNQLHNPLLPYLFTKTELRREIASERIRHQAPEMEPPSFCKVRRELSRYA